MTPHTPNFRKFYHAFRDIIAVVHSSTQLDEVMDLVVWKITEFTKAKGAILRLLNLETNEMELAAAYGIGKKYLSRRPAYSRQTISEQYLQDRIILIDDIYNDPRVKNPEDVTAENIKFIVDVPLSIANDVFGLLRIYFTETRKFSKEELNFIIAIAEQCSCALGKAFIIEAHELRYFQLALQTDKLSSLGRLAAGVAHEINNPLAGILLYSSNMVKKIPEDSNLKEGLDIIIHETIRCRKIIQSLLEFSREREPQMSVCLINEIIEKALTILENEFKLNHIEVITDLSETMVETMVDSNQMEQVIVNLLINAVQVLPDGGIIKVKSREYLEDEVITIEIEDNGPGMRKELLDRIFEPFFSTKANGTGLGLSLSYGIIKNHEGRITVDSSSDRGTKFLVELPIVQKVPERTEIHRVQ